MFRAIISLVAGLMVLAAPLTRAEDNAYQKSGKQRIMVLVSETVDGDESKAHSTEKQIEKFFLDKGFKLIDKTQMEAVKESDKQTFFADPAKAAALGARYGAELIVIGEAEAQFAMESNYGGIQMFFYDANIDLKAVRTDLASVVLVEDAASRKGSNGKLKAAKDALKDAGQIIAGKVEKKLDQSWGEQIVKANEIKLVVGGIDFNGLGKLEPILKKQAGVKSLFMRAMQNNVAEFDIELENISIKDFRNNIAQIKDPALVITGLTDNRIDARIGGDKLGAVDGKKSGAPAVEIEDAKLIDIFPSQYNYYTQNPIGTIKIKNNTATAYKNVKVSIFIPKYMELRSEQVVPELAAGATAELPVKVSLKNDEILKIDENTNTQAEIKVAWFEGDAEKTRDLIKPVKIFDRNSIDWKQKNSIAAFVTPKDDVVKMFTRKAISTVQEDVLTVSNRNLKHAIAIYDALASQGIKYLSDPNTSFSERALDHVQYPRETIMYRTGDCDDTSVLLASCLESIGLTTGLIASADHIFMMFDTGLMPRNALQLGFSKDMFVERDGRLWIPIETTRLDKSFLSAWQLGINEYRNLQAKAAQPEITPVREAWKIYTSVALPEAVKEESWTFPTAQDYNSKVKTDVVELTSAVNNSYAGLVQQLQNAVKSNAKDLKAHGRLCAALVQTNQLEKAGKALDEAFAVKGAQTDPVLNNIKGNYLFMQNKFAEALKCYDAADKADKGSGGYKVNMGFACFALDKEEVAVEHFVTGIKAFKTGALAEAAMGFDVRNLNGYLDNLAAGGASAGQLGAQIEDDAIGTAVDDAKKKTAGPVTVAQVQKKDPQVTAKRNKMLDDALANLDMGQIDTKNNRSEFGGRRGADPTQIKNIKALLYWNE